MTPDLNGARAVLDDFAMLWKTETTPEPRRELLAQVFERVWIDGQRVVAIKPTQAFAPLFAPESTTPPKKGGDVGTTEATGLDSGVPTPGDIEIRLQGRREIPDARRP